jgi:hypothetical protein
LPIVSTTGREISEVRERAGGLRVTKKIDRSCGERRRCTFAATGPCEQQTTDPLVWQDYVGFPEAPSAAVTRSALASALRGLALGTASLSTGELDNTCSEGLATPIRHETCDSVEGRAALSAPVGSAGESPIPAPRRARKAAERPDERRERMRGPRGLGISLLRGARPRPGLRRPGNIREESKRSGGDRHAA